MAPGMPPKKDIGIKTAERTAATPSRAQVIWSMDLRMASAAESPSVCMMRSVFSTTTMASSTSRPMASTRPNMLKVLMEDPVAPMTAIVPSRTMGTAMAGMRVARQFCRKRNMMSDTSSTASMSVCATLLMDAWIKGMVSPAME